MDLDLIFTVLFNSSTIFARKKEIVCQGLIKTLHAATAMLLSGVNFKEKELSKKSYRQISHLKKIIVKSCQKRNFIEKLQHFLTTLGYFKLPRANGFAREGLAAPAWRCSLNASRPHLACFVCYSHQNKKCDVTNPCPSPLF